MEGAPLHAHTWTDESSEAEHVVTPCEVWYLHTPCGQPSTRGELGSESGAGAAVHCAPASVYWFTSCWMHVPLTDCVAAASQNAPSPPSMEHAASQLWPMPDSASLFPPHSYIAGGVHQQSRMFSLSAPKPAAQS